MVYLNNTHGASCSTDLFWHIGGEGASRHSDFTVPPERETSHWRNYLHERNVENICQSAGSPCADAVREHSPLVRSSLRTAFPDVVDELLLGPSTDGTEFSMKWKHAL